MTNNIEISPFKLDLGWKQDTPLALIYGSGATVQNVSGFTEKLKSSLDNSELF